MNLSGFHGKRQRAEALVKADTFDIIALAEIRGLRSEVEALQREIEKLKSRS